MPRYSTSPKEYPGTIDAKDLYPSDLIDGNGNVIDEAVVVWDTETGEVMSFEMLPSGGYRTTPDGNVVMKTTDHKPPLTIKKIGQSDSSDPYIVLGGES